MRKNSNPIISQFRMCQVMCELRPPRVIIESKYQQKELVSWFKLYWIGNVTVWKHSHQWQRLRQKLSKCQLHVAAKKNSSEWKYFRFSLWAHGLFAKWFQYPISNNTILQKAVQLPFLLSTDPPLICLYEQDFWFRGYFWPGPHLDCVTYNFA